jgi:hypothetical protein
MMSFLGQNVGARAKRLVARRVAAKAFFSFVAL